MSEEIRAVRTRDGRAVSSVLYPIAHGELLPMGQTRASTRARATGEFRRPRKGEWYLSGNPVEAWRAPNDLTTKYHIARLVVGRMVEVWEP